MDELNLALKIVKTEKGSYKNWIWHEISMEEYGTIVLNEIKSNSPDLDILDIGYGWGTISIAAHLMCNNVTSLSVLNQTLFVFPKAVYLYLLLDY